MTMSMYSSYTPEDFNNIEEDIFGEYMENESLWVLDTPWVLAMPDRLGVHRFTVEITFQI